MNVKDFTQLQQQALLDLVTLAMYADGHLASAEDQRVHRLLVTLGFATDYDRGKQYDAAVTRVTRHSHTAAGARAYATTQAQLFSTNEQRRSIATLLDEIVTSDCHVSLQEGGLLSVVREVLQQ